MMVDVGLEDVVFRVVDVETTGVDAATAEVCEIAWRDVDLAGAPIGLGMQQSLVNPGVPIPPEASAVHHIVDADVIDAPALSDLIPPLLHEADGRPLLFVAHNSAFERAFLPDAGPWLCTYRLALHLLPEMKSHALQYLRYALKLDVPLAAGSAAHRAAADVEVTCSLLGHLLSLAQAGGMVEQSVERLIQAVDAPAELSRLPFSSQGYAPFSEVDDGYLEWIIQKSAGGRDCVYTAQRELMRRRGERLVQESCP